MKPILTIEAFPDTAGEVFFRVTDMKKGITKFFGYTEFSKLITGSSSSVAEYFPVGSIPEGYIDARLSTDGAGEVILYREPSKHVFLVAVPGQEMPVSFFIPFPGLLFKVRFRKDGGASGSVFCTDGTLEEVKERYQKRELELYAYPFGNVSNDGGICMGNIHTRVSRLAQATDFVEDFLDGITNSDYLSGKSNKMGMGQMEMAQAVEKMDRFPISWLENVSTSSIYLS